MDLHGALAEMLSPTGTPDQCKDGLVAMDGDTSYLD